MRLYAGKIFQRTLRFFGGVRFDKHGRVNAVLAHKIHKFRVIDLSVSDSQVQVAFNSLKKGAAASSQLSANTRASPPARPVWNTTPRTPGFRATSIDCRKSALLRSRTALSAAAMSRPGNAPCRVSRPCRAAARNKTRQAALSRRRFRRPPASRNRCTQNPRKPAAFSKSFADGIIENFIGYLRFSLQSSHSEMPL